LSGSDNLAFTQEFLAEMLGVRRTSVTFDAHALKQSGLIKYSRGRIQIVDVDGLHEGACECYERCGLNTPNCSATGRGLNPTRVCETVTVGPYV
jgi:hypothetical protein